MQHMPNITLVYSHGMYPLGPKMVCTTLRVFRVRPVLALISVYFMYAK